MKKKSVKKTSKKKPVKKAPVKKPVVEKKEHCCMDELKKKFAMLEKRCDDLEATCEDLKKQIQDTFVGEIKENRQPQPTVTVPASIPSSPFMTSINASPAKFGQDALPKSWGAVRS